MKTYNQYGRLPFIQAISIQGEGWVCGIVVRSPLGTPAFLCGVPGFEAQLLCFQSSFLLQCIPQAVRNFNLFQPWMLVACILRMNQKVVSVRYPAAMDLVHGADNNMWTTD